MRLHAHGGWARFSVVRRAGVASKTQAVGVLFHSLHASSRVRGPLQCRNSHREGTLQQRCRRGVNNDSSLESSSNTGPSAAVRYPAVCCAMTIVHAGKRRRALTISFMTTIVSAPGSADRATEVGFEPQLHVHIFHSFQNGEHDPKRGIEFSAALKRHGLALLFRSRRAEWLQPELWYLRTCGI